MCLPNVMKFRHCLFKILKKQKKKKKKKKKKKNVADGQRENSIPRPQTQFAELK